MSLGQYLKQFEAIHGQHDEVRDFVAYVMHPSIQGGGLKNWFKRIFKRKPSDPTAQKSTTTKRRSSHPTDPTPFEVSPSASASRPSRPSRSSRSSASASRPSRSFRPFRSSRPSRSSSRSFRPSASSSHQDCQLVNFGPVRLCHYASHVTRAREKIRARVACDDPRQILDVDDIRFDVKFYIDNEKHKELFREYKYPHEAGQKELYFVPSNLKLRAYEYASVILHDPTLQTCTLVYTSVGEDGGIVYRPHKIDLANFNSYRLHPLKCLNLEDSLFINHDPDFNNYFKTYHTSGKFWQCGWYTMIQILVSARNENDRVRDVINHLGEEIVMIAQTNKTNNHIIFDQRIVQGFAEYLDRHLSEEVKNMSETVQEATQNTPAIKITVGEILRHVKGTKERRRRADAKYLMAHPLLSAIADYFQIRVKGFIQNNEIRQRYVHKFPLAEKFDDSNEKPIHYFKNQSGGCGHFEYMEPKRRGSEKRTIIKEEGGGATKEESEEETFVSIESSEEDREEYEEHEEDKNKEICALLGQFVHKRNLSADDHVKLTSLLESCKNHPTHPNHRPKDILSLVQSSDLSRELRQDIMIRVIPNCAKLQDFLKEHHDWAGYDKAILESLIIHCPRDHDLKNSIKGSQLSQKIKEEILAKVFHEQPRQPRQPRQLQKQSQFPDDFIIF